MKRIFSLLLPVVVTFVFFTATGSYAQNTNAVVRNTALVPVPREPFWLAQHKRFVAEAKKGGVDLLFLGDSITDFWRNRGLKVWTQYYAPRHAANFGISGDRTQHVLWRIDHGELDGIKPKVTVLMIGTNNSQENSPSEITDAIKVIIETIRAKCPGTKILLLGIFPRNWAADGPAEMEIIRQVNDTIARFDDGKTVKYLDIGPKFLGPDGKVSADIMPDFLHPNEKGYRIWAEAMEPALNEMLK
jgi:lysophospholipase L1-like esterase